MAAIVVVAKGVDLLSHERPTYLQLEEEACGTNHNAHYGAPSTEWMQPEVPVLRDKPEG